MSDEYRDKEPIPNSHFWANTFLLICLVAVVSFFSMQAVLPLVHAGMAPTWTLSYAVISENALPFALCVAILFLAGALLALLPKGE